MKISAKTDYTLRAVFELAINRGKRSFSIHEIAKNQGIPKRYLEHLLLMLKKAKIVDSMRGKKGGYVLVKDPEKITIGNIIRSIEGAVDIVPNSVGEKRDDLISGTWKSVQETIEKLFDSITIADLLNKKKVAEKTLTYYI